MKKSIFLSFVFLCGANALDIKEVKGFAHPESIYVDKNEIYVSNLGKELNPLAKDNDGFISKLDNNGNISKLKFIQNLNAPKGMFKINDVLYVVDIDIVYGFKDNKEVFKLPIKNAVFLNDIVALNDDILLISDTGTGLVYKVFLKENKYEEFIQLDPSYGGPNGLLVYKDKLFIAGYDPSDKMGGKIISVDINTKQIQELSDKIEQFDGIVMDKDQNILVSSWGKNLQGYVYVLKNNKEEKLDLPFIKGSADMFFDGKYLWIPKMAENAIIRVKL